MALLKKRKTNPDFDFETWFKAEMEKLNSMPSDDRYPEIAAELGWFSVPKYSARLCQIIYV